MIRVAFPSSDSETRTLEGTIYPYCECVIPIFICKYTRYQATYIVTITKKKQTENTEKTGNFKINNRD